jgi:hypothetical protein
MEMKGAFGLGWLDMGDGRVDLFSLVFDGFLYTNYMSKQNIKNMFMSLFNLN